VPSVVPARSAWATTLTSASAWSWARPGAAVAVDAAGAAAEASTVSVPWGVRASRSPLSPSASWAACSTL